MPNDYTPHKDEAFALPPLPAIPFEIRGRMIAYGHACAEAARAPLAEENARLQARLRSVCQTLVEAVGADGPCDAEDAAARAVARVVDLEAKNNGLLDQHARDSKELRALCEQRDEYLVSSRRLQADKRALLQGHEEQSSEISRLRAEVEALKSQLAAEQADAERYRALRRVLREDMTDAQYDACIDAARGAARKGEGSEGQDAGRLKKYGYAPGDYMAKCHSCGQEFSGADKRATTCRGCAEAAQAKEGAE